MRNLMRQPRSRLLAVSRAHLKFAPARWKRRTDALDGRSPASTLASFDCYCHVEAVLGRNPAAVRRPKIDHGSRTLGLERDELGPCSCRPGYARHAITP
jgi:hypothetical protein